jgi:hypothetical protein
MSGVSIRLARPADADTLADLIRSAYSCRERTRAPGGPGGQAAWRANSGQSTMITESSLPNGLGS